MKQGVPVVSEYLQIELENNTVVYHASVLGQNQGKSIPFVLTQKDSVYTFNNPNHDFPTAIQYTPINAHSVTVHVSNSKRSFSYTMHRVNSAAAAQYNEALATKLGADEYGMKKFIFVLLSTGTNTTTDKDFINECFRGHMNNINTLVQQGKMVVAGPFGKNDLKHRGLFILQNVSSKEEAMQLLANDPAIANNIFSVTLLDWYGSAALGEYLPIAEKITKKKP